MISRPPLTGAACGVGRSGARGFGSRLTAEEGERQSAGPSALLHGAVTPAGSSERGSAIFEDITCGESAGPPAKVEVGEPQPASTGGGGEAGRAFVLALSDRSPRFRLFRSRSAGSNWRGVVLRHDQVPGVTKQVAGAPAGT